MSQAIGQYFLNIYESVLTVAQGMWITLKTAFGERKVTIQYPSHDIIAGTPSDSSFPATRDRLSAWEPFLGASQTYRGPLKTQLAERFRGLLGFDDLKCIGCLMCARACPIEVITVEAVKIPQRKAKAPSTYRINYAKCMFCGLCVEACPTEAVFFSRNFAAAAFDYHDLIHDFITTEEGDLRRHLSAEAKKSQPAAQDQPKEFPGQEER